MTAFPTRMHDLGSHLNLSGFCNAEGVQCGTQVIPQTKLPEALRLAGAAPTSVFWGCRDIDNSQKWAAALAMAPCRVAFECR